MMMPYLLSLLIFFFNHGCSKTDIHVGYHFTLAVRPEYSTSFAGRAFLLETNQMEPNFRVALSVEAIDGKYSCSLEVFLGDVKVWNSGHYTQFYTTDKCVLELTEDGDLQLKGPGQQVGWRTGTFAQGVERLQILKTGNLVLVDALNFIKWQSFNFPTDIMLWGQRLNVATRLTSFPSKSSTFYSFEIRRDKVAMYLNSGKSNYSYWEFKPSKNRNITFVELGSKGLELFNDKHKKIAQISSQRLEPLRFLALENRTGNMGLYFYSSKEGKFKAAFQALNTTCDLPLACKPYGVCTFSNSCSCIQLMTKESMKNSNCSEGIPGKFCDGGQVEMLELPDVISVLRNAPKKINVSKEECVGLCINDCKCLSASYSSGECFIYRVVGGIKQSKNASGLSYMVKVPKGTTTSHGKPKVKKWILVMVGVIDSLIILLVVGGLSYYLVRKRGENPSRTNNTS
ncbi:D-mannose binding lectin protein with Apple-like carbohydrate-binding domain isoform 1 [Tripterygium wilfordii]|uniref:D-mannose binding lectin protein with Apple-like carbohydrate-binding domain isoform 1 n=1 Tax=Tripterygium wilfordii TaxID=458696 RepID=A0A7J7CTQ5_TRIWF|nr:D-mannose binding lectin protein with Apple-like carbohydrate-binding domain isoform 1 [Tripterygium wilfordii]